MTMQVAPVRWARGGDGAAFRVLYEAYAPEVHRYLRLRMTGPDRLVAATMTDVFERAFEQLERGRAGGVTFGAMLYRVARDCASEYREVAPECPTVMAVEESSARPTTAACWTAGDRIPSAA